MSNHPSSNDSCVSTFQSWPFLVYLLPFTHFSPTHAKKSGSPPKEVCCRWKRETPECRRWKCETPECRWQFSWPCPNLWLSSSLPLTRLRDSLFWERGGQRRLYSFDIAPVSLEGQAASSGKKITELIAAAPHNQRTMEPWIMPLFMHTNLSPTHIPCIWNKSHAIKCRAGRKQAFLQ